MKRRRILWKIFPPYLLVTILILGGVGWYGSRALERFFIRETTRDLTIRTRLAVQFLPPLAYFQPYQIDSLALVLSKQTHTRVTIIAPTGQVLGDSHENPLVMDNHADRPEVLAALKTGNGSSTRFSFTRQREMLYTAQPVPNEAGRVLAILRLSVPLDNLAGALASTRSSLLLGGLIFTIIIIALSIFMWSRIARTLNRMTIAAQRFAEGDLTPRLWVPNSREFGGLAESMNTMAAQLDERIREIRRQHNEQQAVLTSMSEGVIALNPQSEILAINHTAARIFQIDREAVIGDVLETAIRNAPLQDFCQKVMTAEKALEQELEILDQDRHLQLHGTALKDAVGNRIGVLIVLNDISRLKKLETMRQDFVANVSHELKTPITGIKGFIETLREGALDDPENAQRFLDIIAGQADRLNAIVEDLLTLSRIEREQEQHSLEMNTGLLRPVLESALADCRYRAEAADVKTHLDCAEELAANINADLIRQAVLNLLDNAINYGASGKRILVRAFEEAETVKISVQDWGPGIPPEHHSRLFERFYRVDKGRSRKLGGTGLGLAIVKHIALAHRGQIIVASEPDQGSIFTILLPLSR